MKPSSRQNPYIRFEQNKSCTAWRSRSRSCPVVRPAGHPRFSRPWSTPAKSRHHRRQRGGQDHAAAHAATGPGAGSGHRQVVRERRHRLHGPGYVRPVPAGPPTCSTGWPSIVSRATTTSRSGPRMERCCCSPATICPRRPRCAVRGREEPHDLRPPDVGPAQRHALDGSTTTWTRNPSNRCSSALEKYEGTLIFRVARPRVRLGAGHAHHR